MNIQYLLKYTLLEQAVCLPQALASHQYMSRYHIYTFSLKWFIRRFAEYRFSVTSSKWIKVKLYG